jgi:hypothetical protein
VKYRKKPVVIDAWPWGEYPDDAPVIDDPYPYYGAKCPKCHKKLTLHRRCETLEGHHIVCPGDWLLKGIAGEYYPCKPAIFEATYGALEEDDGWERTDQ